METAIQMNEDLEQTGQIPVFVVGFCLGVFAELDVLVNGESANNLARLPRFCWLKSVPLRRVMGSRMINKPKGGFYKYASLSCQYTFLSEFRKRYAFSKFAFLCRPPKGVNQMRQLSKG